MGLCLDGGAAVEEARTGGVEVAQGHTAAGVALQELQNEALEGTELAVHICAHLTLPWHRQVALEHRDHLQRARMLSHEQP